MTKKWLLIHHAMHADPTAVGPGSKGALRLEVVEKPDGQTREGVREAYAHRDFITMELIEPETLELYAWLGELLKDPDREYDRGELGKPPVRRSK